MIKCRLMFQDMNEVGYWLAGLHGNNTSFWVGAMDTTGDGHNIEWIHDGSDVDGSFWLPSEPDYADKYCVYLNVPGLAMENCDEGHLYPLCKM